MSEPKNPKTTEGLPPEWSVSNVAPVPTAAAPGFVAAGSDVPKVEMAAPVVAPRAPMPSAPTMDLNVLGAIGSWQRTSPAAPTPPVRVPPYRQAETSPADTAADPQAFAAQAEGARVATIPTKPVQAAVAEPALPEEPVAVVPVKQPLLARAGFWQLTTGVAVVAALALGFMVLQKPASFESAVAPIGVVNTPAPIYLAELGDAKLRVTPLAIVAVPASKDLQLWMFMVDQQTPISLGVLPATGGIFSLPQIPTEGARFVISLEQHGGVMPGKITGEVLYGGTLARR